MINLTSRMKHRAVVGVLLALIGFTGCTVGVIMADRMREAALWPHVNLRPALQRLQQVTDSIPNGSDVAPGAYQQALQEIVANRSDILVAAVVAGDAGTIIATYPENQKLLNDSVVAPLPGARYPIPGLTADHPNWDGIYPFLRPDDPANNAFGPLGWAGNSAPVNFDNPRIEARFRELMLGTQGPEGPAGTPGTPAVAGHLITEMLPRPAGESTIGLLALPRAHRAAYELAAYYLRPAFLIGSLASLVLFWLMLPWWVYLDARPRTEKAVPLAVFVLLTNFLGWLTYLVIRPEAERLCPVCVTLMDPSYRCCPQCGWSRKARCRECGRPARSDWRYCPYCEAPRLEPASVESGLTTATEDGRSGRGTTAGGTV